MSLLNCLQNEDLTQVAVKIADCIATDSAIEEYCMNNFNKSASVYVGPPEALLPTEEDTPLIVVNDMSKNEGLKESADYSAVIFVGVSVEPSAVLTEGGAKVLSGHQKVSELLTLIQDALNRYNCHPPETVEQYLPGLLGESPTLWHGYMAVNWQLDLPIGQQYKF